MRTDNDMLSTIVKEGTSFFKKNGTRPGVCRPFGGGEFTFQCVVAWAVRYQKDAVEDARLVVLTAELAKEQARGLANAFSSVRNCLQCMLSVCFTPIPCHV